MSPSKTPFLTSRRRALFAGVTGALSLTAIPSIVRAINASPPEEEGPFFVEEKLNRSDVRTDTSTGVAREQGARVHVS